MKIKLKILNQFTKVLVDAFNSDIDRQRLIETNKRNIIS